MAVLLDQRQLSGPFELTDVYAIRRAWEEAAAARPFPMRMANGDRDRGLRHSHRTARAYVNEGRWVADCMECNGGIAAGPEFPEGCCLSCGTIFYLQHPPAGELENLDSVMAVRPPHFRHFKPWLETVDDLARENTERGYLESADDAGRGEINKIAAETGLKPDTVARVIAASEKLGRT